MNGFKGGNELKIMRELIAYILVLVLLCMDFFSNWHIWTVVPKTVMIIVFIIGIIICFTPTKKLNLEQNFWLQVRVIAAIIILIFVLPLFGGHSELGLSVTQPFFIIILALSVLQLRMQWKRVQQEKAKEEELKKQQEKLKGKRK